MRLLSRLSTLTSVVDGADDRQVVGLPDDLAAAPLGHGPRRVEGSRRPARAASPAARRSTTSPITSARDCSRTRRNRSRFCSSVEVVDRRAPRSPGPRGRRAAGPPSAPAAPRSRSSRARRPSPAGVEPGDLGVGVALEQAPGRLAGARPRARAPARARTGSPRSSPPGARRSAGPRPGSRPGRSRDPCGIGRSRQPSRSASSVISTRMAAGYHSIDLVAARASARGGPPARRWRSTRASSSSAASATRSGGDTVARAPRPLADRGRLRAPAALRRRTSTGPCMRCLEDADVAVEVDAREVDQPGPSDEELRSPYVDRRRARPRPLGPRRAGARAADPAPVPARLRGPLPGLRRLAQRRRPGRARATKREPDPRWAKLRELKLDQ